MDYSQPQPKLIYPEESRRNREQGSVSVGLIVPPTGCAREGFVLGSSGFERLDRAAVSYAMSLHLLPAEENGISIEALAVLPINFALRSAQTHWARPAQLETLIHRRMTRQPPDSVVAPAPASC